MEESTKRAPGKGRGAEQPQAPAGGGAKPAGEAATKPAANPPEKPPEKAPEKPPGKVKEIGGPAGPEPTRYGDWERKGRCIDF